MSFDKDYPNRKDHRKPYTKKAEKCNRSCRPGGSCPYCRNGRLRKRKPLWRKDLE
jgi:hypothetical protein